MALVRHLWPVRDNLLDFSERHKIILESPSPFDATRIYTSGAYERAVNEYVSRDHANPDPFTRDTPERVEGTLDDAFANCIAYNAGKGFFAGAYLAVGRTDGFVAIWDLETKNILRWFGGHVKTVSAVSWSPNGRYLATSSLDWNVIIWDLGDGPAKAARILRFDAPVALVVYSPTSSRLLLVILESREAFLVHFPTSTGNSKPMRTTLDSADPVSTACFTADGRFLFVGSTKGSIGVFNAESGSLIRVPVSIGASAIRQMALDAQGRHLVLNMNDRTIRTFSVMEEVDGTFTFVPEHKFQDLVGRTPWSGIAFSSDAEYVMGGAAHDAAHNIYVWDREAGVLVKILEGPREPLISAQWHPTRAQIASIASSGDVHLWSTPSTEIWSAYAPGFEELDKNVEYEEREDEFDLDDRDDRHRQCEDEAEYVNIFSNGPASDAILVRLLEPVDLHRPRSTLAPRNERIACEDDDDQVTFFLPPLLDEVAQEA